MEDQESTCQPLTIINTHRGLGYQEKDESFSSNTKKDETVRFVAGEILTPMVVEPEPVVMSLEDKMLKLESHLAEVVHDDLLKLQIAAQLEVLKDAWTVKKLETDYLHMWLENIEMMFKKKEEPSQDQVIDMVLEDSETEDLGTAAEALNMQTKTGSEGEECLDSALNSFYTDLATLDMAESELEPTPAPALSPAATCAPTPATAVVTDSLKGTDSEVSEDVINNDPVKGIKRSKMSQDMTSLVAKWQKIHKDNT